MRANVLIASVVATLLAGVSAAHAQMPTVDPGGTPAADPAPATPAGPPAPVIIPITPDGQIPGQNAPEDDGYYHLDDTDSPYKDQWSSSHFGPVPELHVVRRGDTLWDICWFYFNNPWEWPKVWSYNESITNPHWIYPGDLVRLYPAGMTPVVDSDPDFDIQPTPARRYGVSLRQLAYVDRDKLKYAAYIDGSVEEKMMLSTGDTVYLEYPGKPPKVGKRYAIYTEKKKVKHPDSEKEVGAFVRILGELEIISVKKGKRAKAIITDSVDVIERGALVGKLERTYQTVEPTSNKVDLQGTIVAMLASDQLIGEGQIVFIDKGSKEKLEVGNRMFVVRRGDAYDDIMEPDSGVGQDDRRFPARALGEVIIVQTGKHASVGLVTLSLQELGVGDLVLMRKSRDE
jgi:hypothetical protein